MIEVGMSIENQVDIRQAHPHLGQRRLNELPRRIYRPRINEGNSIPLEQIEEDYTRFTVGGRDPVDRLVDLDTMHVQDLRWMTEPPNSNADPMILGRWALRSTPEWTPPLP
jgi:hypothetical protein